MELVNGSRGVVIKFTQPTPEGLSFPIVKFDNGQIETIDRVEYNQTIYKNGVVDGSLIRMQVPLKLAWASTIHKSQGIYNYYII